jgi:hypothetical protein
MIDKLLVSVFASALAVIIATQVMLCSLPLFKRLEFDAVCHQYTIMMDRSGGLGSETAARLRQDLYSRGFLIRQLSGTVSATYGNNLDLYIAVDYPTWRINSSLMTEEVILSFEYQSRTVCRLLKSYDAVP